MSKASDYVDHMYSLYEGRAAITVGVNSDSEIVHPFVYENTCKVPVGLVAMCAGNISAPTEVDLYHVSAFITGRGQGSEMMNFICETADIYGVRLCIEASSQFNGKKVMTDAALRNWYRKYGFKGNSSMHREPASRHG